MMHLPIYIKLWTQQYVSEINQGFLIKSVDINIRNIQIKQINTIMDTFIFTMNIKIADRNINVIINKNDTIETILCALQKQINYPLNTNLYRRKILQYLQKIKTNPTNSKDLLDKIGQFIQRQNYSQKTQGQKKEHQAQDKRKNQIQKENFKQYDNNYFQPYQITNKQNSNLKNQKKDNLPNIQSKSEANMVHTKISQQSNKKKLSRDTHKSKQVKNKQQKKHNNHIRKGKQIDDDLVKAYQVIYNKCKDKSMREMAQISLKQIGKFQEQKKIVHKKFPTKTTIIYNAYLNEQDQEEQILRNKIQNSLEKEQIDNILNQKVDEASKAQSRLNKAQFRVNPSSLTQQNVICKQMNVKKFQYTCAEASKNRLIYSYGIEDKQTQNSGESYKDNRPKRFKYL